ncbi:MAG: PD-(D/E)XK nuclease family protein [Bacteroidales bacterium]|nr:PD-(D/E)XK nuclease family protein [Bacteroidales bacterium]
MEAFLEKSVKYLFKKYQKNIDKLCIVLPNRRAGLFFKKYLANEISNNIWSPAIYSIEDFILKFSGFQNIDRISLLFEFYHTHKEIEKEKALSLDDFLSWAQVLLHDFNEIDQYLVDPEKIFKYLNETKALETWNLNRRPLTEFEIKYLKFFNSLFDYYQNLRNRLISKKLVYQGLAYRVFSENIASITESMEFEKIIFIGFNALTTVEEKIIKYLKTEGKAEILIDADRYYIENKQQEAGRFLRKYPEIFNENEIAWTTNYFAEGEKTIEIIGVPQNIGQAKAAGQILQENIGHINLEKTAIVLNDENLLIPVLNSIPNEISEFNVTMGLSAQHTPLFTLFDVIFNLHLNSTKLSKINTKNKNYFFGKDIIKIIQHPFIKIIISEDSISRKCLAEKVISEISRSNKIFLSTEGINKIFEKSEIKDKFIIKSVFGFWNNEPSKALDYLSLLIEKIRDTLIESENKSSREIDIEFLFHFSKIIKRIKSIRDNYGDIEHIKTLKSIFNQISKSSSIPFYGEPLKGLQIMGMLETRTIDFDTIIMLSVNDDIIPSGKSQNSFIPFDLKKEFKLPTYQERNAVFAYHFYRLLQRAKNIYLLYNTESGNFGGGDKSRFLTQIAFELPSFNKNIKINERFLSTPIKHFPSSEEIVVEKDKEIMATLIKKASKGFSPSSLNAYRNCSLRFYFSEIVGLSELDEIEETIDAATLGTVVHDVLQTLFTDYITLELKENDIKAMIANIEAITNESFLKHFPGGNIKYGKNLLIVRVANIFVKRFLQQEKKVLKTINAKDRQLIIKYLEKKLESFIDIDAENNNSLPKKIKVKGICDRIDLLENTWRIIDYKTGLVTQNEINIKNWEDFEIENKHNFSFQLMLYAYLFYENNSELFKKNSFLLESGIFSFRNISQGLLKVNLPEKAKLNKDTTNDFKTLVLIPILNDIFNKEIPFEKTSELKTCTYCPFISICGRQ